ncbi:MAG: EAL domain-containing protein [Rhodospirillales bacterium]|jgi:hypothetical protein|nr:EAL domain-containing protein [Rhodospirillales bacterium]
MALFAPDPAKRTPSSQESLLVDYLFRLENFKKGRRALQVNLSKLEPQNKREQHIRAAASSFEPMVKRGDGQLFTLTNSDLIFVFKSEADDDVQAVVTRLRFMFADDPLLLDDIPGVREQFCFWYEIARDYEQLLERAKSLADAEEMKRKQSENVSSQFASPQQRQGGIPLTPELLGRIEDALSQADLSNLVRRQSVCAIVGRAAPQQVSTELFVSIADLRATLIPNANFTSSPWLFQHLTETLDRRVLSLLSKNDDRSLTQDFSVNLNVATLLSPEFLKFDDNVRSASRGTIVIELQKTDIFYDLSAFMFARDFVHERGYRICIDGLNHQALRFVDRAKLGADLIKLVWSADLPEILANDVERDKLTQLILERSPGRMIMCRCDTVEAIQLGQSLGLTLFQGRFVDQRLYDITQQGLRAKRLGRR